MPTQEYAQYILGFFSAVSLALSEVEDIKNRKDSCGRAIYNAFIERLWRSVKYEKIYLNPPKDGLELFLLLAEYFDITTGKEDMNQSITKDKSIFLKMPLKLSWF